MAIFLGHLLSLLAVVAYGYAAFKYARVLSPAGGGGEGAELIPRLRHVLGIGLFCHVLFLFIEHHASASPDRFPVAVSLISICVVGVFLALESRYRIAALGVFIAPLALMFMLVSAITFHLPGSSSTLFPGHAVLSMHLICTVFSYTLLVVAAGSSAAFLLSEGSLKRKKHFELSRPFPSLVFLERFHRAVVLFGFLFLILGVATGVAYSSLVSLGASETLDRLRWVLPVILIYALLAGAIYPFRVRGRKMAWFTIGGCFVLVASLLGAGLLTGSFHL